MVQPYCSSRYRTIRRVTREVMVGHIGVGGSNPIRVQSMTNTLTQDVDATVRQVIALAEAGCEIVRITAPNKEAARALKDISAKVRAAGFNVPLVADIHFLPIAAMEAIEHVEKVRVNPGNYADKKKFAVRDYSDAEYDEELERLHEAFSPLVKRAKELGRALRIGTNHGSLSDRIMNRYGDSPLGMVESALEFIRICESNGFRDIILSMKASNPKVMIQAYRLAVMRMNELGMNYPLHLGVTEAGDGEDARIKSAIGIGSLLADGLGDTVRVSLTEDPVYEVPVCRDLVARVERLWQAAADVKDAPTAREEKIDFYSYERRDVGTVSLGEGCCVSREEPPRVIVRTPKALSEHAEIAREVLAAQGKLREARIEGLMLPVTGGAGELKNLSALRKVLSKSVRFFVLELADTVTPPCFAGQAWPTGLPLVFLRRFGPEDGVRLREWAAFARARQAFLAVDADDDAVAALAPALAECDAGCLIFTLSSPVKGMHAPGSYRALIAELDRQGLKVPVWVRVTSAFQIEACESFGGRLLDASIQAGSLFTDGLSDLISVENEPNMLKATTLAYDILQGSRMRSTKTEFVACPSCGRTLFDLQTTTQKIKARTGHLKGVTIAVMGCIVNGPGEMADADFGYVGGAPGKVNLYVGKTCVKYNIAEDEAVDRLVDLIREHNKWVEPPVEPVAVK